MSDYLKFYIPFGMVLSGCAGFVLGGAWTWLGFATFPLLAVIDTLLPVNMNRRRMNSAFWATVPVWLAAAGTLIIYLVAAWRLSMGEPSTVELTGIILSLTWLSVVPGGPASHELWHMRHGPSRALGHLTQICMFDGLRDIGHVAGHHIDVCTPKDGDTSPRGQTLYWFALHELFVSARICLQLETSALVKRGKSPWHWSHRGWRFLLVQGLFQAVLFAIAGWLAVGVALVSMLAARIWVESFNYFQHYGLVRLDGAPIGNRHVWNHMSELSRVASFEITNHAGHHQDAYTPYYKLVPHPQAIPMPSLFVCFFAALVPPLWHTRIIKPALKRWDLEYATAEERIKAREQNAKAGWPDWVAEAGEAVGQAPTVGC